MQRAIDAEGRHLFLLKGGTLLQHRLNATARTTKDVDGLIRGDLDQFILALDEAFGEPWGPLILRRGEVEVVNVPTMIIKPRRFDIILELRGVTWRRIQFEVSPDESGVSDEHETIEPPPLGGFGLPDPDALVGIAMRFQIAQSSTLSPTRTSRRTLSTTAPVTSWTCSSSVISPRQVGTRRWLRFGRQRWRCSQRGPTRQPNSASRLVIGLRRSWLIRIGSTTSPGPLPRAVWACLSTRRLPR